MQEAPLVIAPFSCLYIQLFLEEERERELEGFYEAGLADSLNRADGGIGSGSATADATAATEATGVSKQTSETLMAGEKIMEALELADGERAAFAAYHADGAKLTPAEAARLPPPERNAVLKAYDMEPEAYVLSVVEKVQGPALQDALLVLPFGKVVSLMEYLNEWAKRVRGLFLDLVDWAVVLTLFVDRRNGT